MDEIEFQRILNLFPIVRPRDYQYVDTRRLIAQPAQHENSQDAPGRDGVPSNYHRIDQLDTFWVKLQTVAEKKVGAADAEIFCEGFRKIYKKLVNELSLDAARNFLSSSNSYGQ